MSCRIDRIVGVGDLVVLRVSGRIRAENVDTLRELLEREKAGVAIDLKEVTLVDRDAVIFLALSETGGSNSGTVQLIYVNGSIERGLKLVLISRTSRMGKREYRRSLYEC
jgi:anti-anti-sigma regulatory factor